MRDRTAKSGAPERPKLVSAEEALVQSARSYADEQKRKTVKWFVSQGPPVATTIDNARTAADRESQVRELFAAARQEDRLRTDVEHVTSRAVAIPTSSHPLHNPEADVSSKISFSTVAVNGMDGRKELFRVFEQISRIVLLRNRLDVRLQALHRKENHRLGVVGAAASANDEDLDAIPHLALLDMCSLPTSVSSTDTVQLSATGPEAPSAASISLFAPKTLAVPFEFRNQSLRQLRFADHPFQNADLPEAVEVLPAGYLEAPQSQALAPAIEHFVQPVITLETFPAPPFAFDCAAPYENGVRSEVPQRVSDGGFQPRFHGEAAVRTRTYTRPDVLSLMSVSASTPKLLQERPAHHDMSDSDDDDELPAAHPAGLHEVSGWLRQLAGHSGSGGGSTNVGAAPPNHAAGGTRNSVIKPANEGADGGAGGAGSLSSMTTTVVDPAQSRRREQSHAFLDTMLRELPASLHLQF